MELTASMASIGADVEQMNPRFRKKLFVLRIYRLHENKMVYVGKGANDSETKAFLFHSY